LVVVCIYNVQLLHDRAHQDVEYMGRILVVDDQKAIRLTLSEFLGDAGHNVHTAEKVVEALRIMGDYDFDVIVTDVVLPRLGGVDLLNHIREASPDIQVIMITGEPSLDSAAAAVRAGAFDYLIKPVTKATITRVVGNAVRLKVLKDEKVWLEEENRRYRENLEEVVDEQTGTLRESEAKYRAAVEQSADIIFIMDVETKEIIDSNPMLRAALGYSEDETRGLSVYEFVNHPRDDIDARIARLMKEGRGFLGERQYRRKDGTLIDVEVGAHIITFGGHKALCVVSRDITSRKKEEENRRRLEAAITQAAEVIVITDAEGMIDYVNPAFERVTGYSSGEVAGENPKMLSSGQHEKGFYDDLWKTILSGETWRGEFVNRKKDGSLYNERAVISPVKDPHGKIVNFIAVKEDVTEHKKAQQRIREEEEKRRNVVINTGHLLYTPLTVVKGNLELIQRGIKEFSPDILSKMLVKLDDVGRLISGELYSNIERMTVETSDGYSPVVKRDTDVE